MTNRHRAIALYKTAIKSFYLPITLALLLCWFSVGWKNKSDQDYYKVTLNIFLPLREYLQILEDYLDYAGTPEQIGKVSMDIMDKHHVRLPRAFIVWLEYCLGVVIIWRWQKVFQLSAARIAWAAGLKMSNLTISTHCSFYTTHLIMLPSPPHPLMFVFTFSLPLIPRLPISTQPRTPNQALFQQQPRPLDCQHQ
jgi:Polyprenyl synthetase